MRGEDESESGEGHERAEPPRLPEERELREREGGARFVPEAVVVARLHAERVAAGREVRVRGHALRAAAAGLQPSPIEALQTVGEADAGGDAKARRGVADLELARAG